MKKQFQSKSVPRGTRTIWRYLGALFILFTFAIGNVWGGVTTVTFTSANKNDAGDNFATMSSNSSQMVGNGIAKLINASSSNSSLLAESKKDGYQIYGGRCAVVFYFDGTTTLDLIVTTNGQSKRDWALYSFSSTKALSAIEASDYSTKTIVSTGITTSTATAPNTSATFTFTNTSGVLTPSASGCGKITYSSLAAGFYVFCTNCESTTCLYQFTANVSSGGSTTYSITYDCDGAESGCPANVASATALPNPLPSAPVKDGFTFDGWFTNSTKTTAAVAGAPLSADATLYAKWTENAPASSDKLYFWFSKQADATAASVTNNENSFFGGTLPSGSGSVTASITIDGKKYDVTQYSSSKTPTTTFTVPANKAGKLYAIVKSGGSGRKVQLKKGSTTIQEITWETSATAHDFNAVGPGEYTITSTGNMNWAMFAVKIYDGTFHSVSFDSDGGSAVESLSVLEGTKATKPTDPTKDNNEFAGWVVKSTGVAYDWDAIVSADVVLKATWTPAVVKHTISFNSDGGTAVEPIEVEDGQAATAPTAPKKAGYEFDKWYNGESVYDWSAAVTGDLALTAHWNKVYVPQGANYSFAGQGTMGTAPKAITVTTDNKKNSIANYSRVDNIFFSAMDVYCESGTTGGDDAATGFKGWKIKTSGATIKFYVENDSRVSITMGTLSSGCNITYTAKGASSTTTTALTGGAPYYTDNYNVAAGSLVTLTTQEGNTVTLKGIAVSAIPAKDNDATLKDLKVGGVTIAGFAAATHTYYYELPYGTDEGDIPTITASANSTKALQVAIEQAVWTDAPYNCYRAQANVQAEDESWGYYDVRFVFAPKYGVELIKATHDGTAAGATITGYIGGQKDKDTYANGKLGEVDKYFGIKLAEGKFQAGDLVEVKASMLEGGNTATMFTDKGETALNSGAFDVNLKVYRFTLTEETEWIYIYRKDGSCNPRVQHIAVYRQMAPFIESFEIAGIGALTINGTNITAEVSQDFDVTALTPTIKYWGNGGGAIDKTGAQDFTSPVTYTVSSAYADDATGDYAPVTYTVTITKVVPSATPSITTQPQGANYYEGATIAALSVVAEAEDNGTLTYQWYLGDNAIDAATEATYTPTVSEIGSYSYTCVVTNKKGDKPATSVTSSAAVITISEDPAAIKLIVDGTSGKELNTAAFYLGSSLTSVEIASVNHACVKLAGGATASTAPYGAGQNDDRVIAYNATTTKTKIQVTAYSNTNSARSYTLSFVEEGQTAAQAAEHNVILDLPTDYTIRKTDWYTFNSDKNRTIYITIPGNNSNYHFLQVKVIESGEPLKKAGEIGYAMNFNVGRMIGKKQKLHSNFEGFDFYANNDYKIIQSTSMVISNADNDYIKFHAVAPMTLAVSTENANSFYVTKGAKGTANETLSVANGVSYIDLDEAADWYISPKNGDVKITNIAFAAPKCAEPVIDNEPVSNTNVTVGDNLTATVVAHATDGADLAYQWYDASDDSEVSGATEATLTTTTPGEYYVVITASKSGYDDRTVQSANATLGYRDNTIATLSALSYGGNAIALEADKYEYRVDLAEGTTDVPALAATATQASYGATAVPTDATEFVNYEAISTVLVTAEDGTTTQTYTVHFYVDHIYTALVDVTGSTTWNWTGSEEATINDVANKGLILANYIDGLNFEKIEGKEGERARRNQNGGCYQGTQLHFNTTVYGKVKIYFRAPSSGDNCTIYVNNNGKRMNVGNRGNSFGWSKEVIVKGDVVIEMVKDGGGDTRVQQIVFTQVAPDYTREVSNNIGTLCVDHNVLAGGFVGATFYQIASRNEIYNDKIDFEEVGESEELVAGQPYIFQSTTGRIDLFYGATVADAPVAVRGMIGSFVDTQVDIDEENKSNILYIANNRLWNCEDMVGSYLDVVANRAYIVMSDVPTYAEAHSNSNGAPRRRVTLGKDAEQVVTGVENLNASEQPVKLLINGQIFILRGEKMFDATGRLVK